MVEQTKVALRPSEMKATKKDETYMGPHGCEWSPQMISISKELSTADAPALEGLVMAIDMAYEKAPHNPGILWTRLLAMSKLMQGR